MTPPEYCLSVAAPEGSSNYYAFLFHSASERRTLAACFALLAELRDSRTDISDPAPALRRLEWWAEQISALPNHTAPHPVLLELGSLDTAPVALRARLLPAVGAAIQAAAGYSPETVGEWRDHCLRFAAGPWLLAAGTTEAPVEEDRIAALAACCAQADQLLDLTMGGSGSHLPRSVLRQDGIEAGHRANARLDAAVREFASAIVLDIDRWLDPGNCPSLPRFCRVLAGIHRLLCLRVTRNPALLRAGRPALTPLRKLWIAWRMN